MRRLQPSAVVQSTWQYGEDGELRRGCLPYGWNDECNMVKWDDGEIEYVDRTDFKVERH